MLGGVDETRGINRQTQRLPAVHLETPEGLQEGAHHRGVELLARAAQQLGAALAGGERRPVRTFVGHGVVGVDYAERPRHDGDLVSGQPVRVTVAVEAFVMVTDARHEVVVEQRRHDLGADRRVLAHELPLLGVQRTGLVQHAVGDADLADVVQVRHVLDPGQTLLGPAELPSEQGHVGGHAAGVPQRVVVLGVQGRAQSPQVAEVQMADLVVEAGIGHGQGGLLPEPAGKVALSLGKRAFLAGLDADELAERPAAVHERHEHEALFGGGERLGRPIIGAQHRGVGHDGLMVGRAGAGSCEVARRTDLRRRHLRPRSLGVVVAGA